MPTCNILLFFLFILNVNNLLNLLAFFHIYKILILLLTYNCFKVVLCNVKAEWRFFFEFFFHYAHFRRRSLPSVIKVFIFHCMEPLLVKLSVKTLTQSSVRWRRFTIFMAKVSGEKVTNAISVRSTIFGGGSLFCFSVSFALLNVHVYIKIRNQESGAWL